MSDETFRAAIVQRPPVLLDRDGSMQRVLDGLEEVAGSSARLAVFPETYLPGYPDYIWRLRPGDADDYELADKIHGRLVQNAVDLEADDLKPVREAARRHSMFVVIGVHERDPGFSRSTLFNTVVTIGADGEVLNRHRKLVPTGPERMVWGPGDGSGLRVLETPLGRLGGLICWENYMPLARFSLYAQGLQIWVAPTWDEGDGWLATIRHIALEGRCWVLGAGCSVQAKDVPADFPGRDRLYPDPEQWLNSGDSVIVDPWGEVVAGPLHAEHGIVSAEIDPSLTLGAHHTFDAAGHYNRPDVFSLRVDRSRRRQVSFEDASAPTESRDVLEI